MQSKDGILLCYPEYLTTQIERVNSDYSKLVSKLELKRQMLYRNTEEDNSYTEYFNYNDEFSREAFFLSLRNSQILTSVIHVVIVGVS